MSTKKVVKTRGSGLVIRHRIHLETPEESQPSPRLRSDCKTPSAPRQRGRGRSLHTEAETGDE